MEFLTFIAVCILIYLVYLIRQDFKDHSVRIESQMQRVTEVVIKSQDKDEEYLFFLTPTMSFSIPN